MPVTKSVVEGCINHLNQWLTSNRFRLNPDKTKGMLCATSRQATTLKRPSFWNAAGQSVIQPTSGVRNIGDQLRLYLTINDKLSAVVRRCRYNIKQLGFICSASSRDTYAQVSSRLEFYTLYMPISGHTNEASSNAIQYCDSCCV